MFKITTLLSSKLGINTTSSTSTTSKTIRTFATTTASTTTSISHRPHPHLLFTRARPSPISTCSSHVRQLERISQYTTIMSTLPKAQLPESLSGLTSKPKLHLYTASTPNGYKASIALEELVRAYPDLAKDRLSYDFIPLSFAENDQKKPEFLKINPNGRIPALVDDNFGGHNVFETASILIWLVENYDPESKFWFTDPLLRSKALSWIFFAHGGVGPMQGQANHFYRYAPEKIPYGIKRYQDETARLYSVLEDGLNSGAGEWLVGDKYSIADINVFAWVRSAAWAGVDITQFPKLEAWVNRIEARPGAYAGLGIPTRGKKLTKEEEEAHAKQNSAWILAGQKK
ncbi:glutathione S-transferase [Naematelia encephala]|uniref:Glutathione S-transferase n=1 Tax=Naematelia encephala TaxID=71784 RepID=A0A1Y2B004_9TREE|nr:glutathione S-transferase [Naematelia encephala]